MKTLLTLLTITLLILDGAGCGAGKNTSSASSNSNATAGSRQDTNDISLPKTYDSDDAPVRFFGHEANPSVRQAITTLIKRYYAAAAKDDGARACPLIHPLTVERVIEDHEDQSLPRGKTCAVVMSKIFKQNHQQLAVGNATLKVTAVRVENNRAMVLLRVANAAIPTHVPVHRQGDSWKMWELFDSTMP